MIIPIPGATAAERVNENCEAVEISRDEKEELDRMIKSFDVAGHRQIPGGGPLYLDLVSRLFCC